MGRYILKRCRRCGEDLTDKNSEVDGYLRSVMLNAINQAPGVHVCRDGGAGVVEVLGLSPDSGRDTSLADTDTPGAQGGEILPPGHTLGRWIEGIKCLGCGALFHRKKVVGWITIDHKHLNVCPTCGHLYDHKDGQGEWIAVAVREERTRKGAFVRLHEKGGGDGEAEG